MDSGQGSFLPDAPTGENLKALLPPPDFVKAELLLDPAYRQDTHLATDDDLAAWLGAE